GERGVRAAARGVTTSYNDWADRLVEVSDETVRAVLDVLGDPVPAPSTLVSWHGRPKRLDLKQTAQLILEDGSAHDIRDEIPADVPMGWHTMQHGATAVTDIIVPQRVAEPERTR